MFYLINKPLQYSSFDVIRKLRKITGIKKMGHTGTLDPLATGCILIATENSTKLISHLENTEKTYTFTVDISHSSPSLDGGSEITLCDISQIQDNSEDALRIFLESQTSQKPPKFSAIHVNGKRAYHLARSGKEFTLPDRPIRISQVEILEKRLPIVRIRLTISAGGYIRSLAPIIGGFFGTTGGYITHLCRERIGNLSLNDAQEIETFQKDKIIPYTSLFQDIEIRDVEIIHKKRIIDGLIVDIGSPEERQSKKELFVRIDDLFSLCQWTETGLKVLKNYV